MVRAIFTTLVIVLLVGCQYDPHAHTYTTHQPSIEEITGNYELSENWMEHYAPDIKEKIKALPEIPLILINASGEFTVDRFPYFSEDTNNHKYSFVDFKNFKGKWELAVVGGVDNGIKIKECYGLHLSNVPTELCSPGFTGTKKVDGLIFGFGDPDSGHALIFNKKTYKQKDNNKEK